MGKPWERISPMSNPMDAIPYQKNAKKIVSLEKTHPNQFQLIRNPWIFGQAKQIHTKQN